MSFSLIVSISRRNLFRNPRRTALTLFAMTLAVWSTVSLSALARGISSSIVADTLRTLTGHIQIHAPGFRDDPVVEHRFEIDAKLRDSLSTVSKVWAARVRVPGMVASERESLGVTILGIDPHAEKTLSFLPDSIAKGALLDSVDDKGIILGKKAAERLKTDVGRRIVLMTQSATEGVADRGFRVIGIFDTELENVETSYVFIGRSVAQRMIGMGNGVSEIALLTPNPDTVSETAAALSLKFPALSVSSWMSLEPFLVALVKVQSGFLILWFFIVVVAVSFGLVNTLFMSIFERVREMGMMQALGMKPHQIVFLILGESLLLLVAGTVLGVTLSVAAIEYFQRGIDVSAFAQGAARIGLRSVIYPVYVPSDWVAALCIVFTVGVASSLYPAIRAARLTPQESLRNG